MPVPEALQSLRKPLVLAAEGALKPPLDKLEKSQLNHLIAVCNEASCAKEIELYLRYQASRQGRLWPPQLVDQVIRAINDVFKEHCPKRDDDVLETGAWRLYAVYLARTFTYQKAVELRTGGAHGGRS
jgi:hypothetical protein